MKYIKRQDLILEAGRPKKLDKIKGRAPSVHDFLETCDLETDDYEVLPEGIHVFTDFYITQKSMKDLGWISTGELITELPFKFYRCDGDFDISRLKLTSLKNCPEEVGGEFLCFDNKLKTLEFAPKKCVVFDCSNNELKSLEGCPECEKIECSVNSLTTLEFLPTTCREITCDNNSLNTLEHIRNSNITYISVEDNDLLMIPYELYNDGSHFYLNPIEDLLGYITNFDIRQVTEKEILERLEEFDVVDGNKIDTNRFRMLIDFFKKEEFPTLKLNGYTFI